MMRTRRYGFVAVTTLAVGLLVLPVILAGQNSEQESNLKELLRKRRDTLQQVVDVVIKEYHLGNKSFDSVVQAKDRLIDAELEMVNSRQGRIALLQQQVEMFEAFSDRTRERYNLGEVNQSERLAALAAVLDAKIKLVREQDGSAEGESDQRPSN